MEECKNLHMLVGQASLIMSMTDDARNFQKHKVVIDMASADYK